MRVKDRGTKHVFFWEPARRHSTKLASLRSQQNGTPKLSRFCHTLFHSTRAVNVVKKNEHINKK